MIKTQLMKHQTEAVKFMLKDDKKYHGVFLAYGTGKTVCALAYTEAKKFNRILVISTKTAVSSTWTDEIRKHTDYKCVLMIGNKKQKLSALEAGMRMSQIPANSYHSGKRATTFFLTNIDGVHSLYEYLVRWSRMPDGTWYANGSYFDFLILDESTKAKDPNARRTKVMWALGEQVPYKAILTGFPISESLIDIFAQIKILDQGVTLGKKYYDFLETYFVRSGFDYVPKKNSTKKILEKLKPFCIHMTNSNLNLPAKIYKTIHVEPTEQQLTVLEELKNLFRLEFKKVRIDTEFIFCVLARCLQVCDGFIQDSPIKDSDGNIVWKGGNIEGISTKKDEALLDLLDEIDITRNKVIIWFKFRYSLQKVAYLLKKAKIPVLIIMGGADNINWSVNQFQNPRSGYNIVLATQKKASESITLTEARYAIYYSRDYSQDLRSNSEARNYRKGSEKWRGQTMVYSDLVTRGSLEETVMECLQGKQDLVNKLKTEFLEIQEQGNEIKEKPNVN